MGRERMGQLDRQMPNQDHVTYAYEIHEQRDMPIVTAPVERQWMDATGQHFAYRCLPLVIANQSGWLIQNPTGFTASWNGKSRKEDLAIEFDRTADPRIKSHFGHGVLTISLPYLFRTPHGINLWVKGPSNWIKDGAQALEGVVESDWSPATFTMNWKLTRPGHLVRFDRGEPICMIVPVARGLAETLVPRREPLRSNPELEQAYRAWDEQRRQFLESLSDREPETVRRGWEKDYFQGHSPEGPRFEEHQTRLHLKEFEGPDGTAYPPLEFPRSESVPSAAAPKGQGRSGQGR